MEEEFCNEAVYKLTKASRQKVILESKTKKADYTTKAFSLPRYIAIENQQIFCSWDSRSARKKTKWTSVSLGSRKQKLHSKIQSFVFKKGLIWMKKQQSNLSLQLLFFGRMDMYFRNVNKIVTWLHFYIMDTALKNKISSSRAAQWL